MTRRARTPMLIVLEGLDGCGKSTVARLVAQRLGARLCKTPDSSLDGARAQIEETFGARSPALTLFYASTVLAASDDARAELERGRTVVLDRYWMSTLAYARASGRDIDLEGVEPRLLPADLTVFLHANRLVRAERLGSRCQLSDHDLLSVNPAGEAALLATYRALAAHRIAGRVLVLDSTKESARQIARRVCEEVRS